jgi:predicted O-methyltransferase YrrM
MSYTTDLELRFAPTTMQDWERSDTYHNSFLISKDDVLEAALKNNFDNGLPDISVTAAQGKFLKLLALSIGAKRILEVGTLGGYSTIWLAQALPKGGEITTFEISEKVAEVARQNIANAGYASSVTVVVGPAIDSLRKLQPAEQPYDFMFIDADKPSNLDYFIEAKRLVRKGGIIIVDNVIRNGLVSKPEYSDNNVEGVRRLLKSIQHDQEVDATAIATVGDKGYDGFLYARKL